MRAWLLAALLLGGCSLTDPQEEAQGPSDRGNGPEHRAGEPCLVCHGFAVAGTVYAHALDTTGLAGATVEMTDAQGRVFTATSNQVGNFYVEVGGSTRAGRDGQAEVAFDPVFPLHVKVRAGGIEQVMRTAVGRDGSCAACHSQDSATSVARVFVREAGQ